MDLECVICQTIPEPQNGNLHIFSCQNHHILCNVCLLRVDSCPGTKYIYRVWLKPPLKTLSKTTLRFNIKKSYYTRAKVLSSPKKGKTTHIQNGKD